MIDLLVDSSKPESIKPMEFHNHVANVQATSLQGAVKLIYDSAGGVDVAMPWQPREKNQGFEPLVPGPRNTLDGEVIVDPQGQPWRVDGDGFEAINEGTYRVWQAHDRSAVAAGWGAFPGDYRPAIDVSTDSRERAYALVNGGAWWEDRFVDVIADEVRSTRAGDVIVDPAGKSHRITPDGFAEIDPAKERAAKDEPPLERVERQLRDWKHDHSTEFVPDPATGRLGPGTHRWLDDAWGVMTVAEKLHVLENLDWSGVGPEDKRRLLDREVDLARVPEEARSKFLGEASRDTSDTGRAAAGPSARGEYQVWHDRGWPQSRIDQMLGGAPPSHFPHDYFHAADVRAGSPEDAVRLTTGTGHVLEGDHRPWDDNPGVRSYTPKPFAPRDTDAGDVIVDPQGQAHRYDGRDFREIEADARPTLPSPGQLRDGRDEMPTPEEWRKLEAEWTHDYGLRRLEDRGVKYEDEARRGLDITASARA